MSGEQVPLSPQFLLEALRAASSESQGLIQQASNQLKEWEKQSGYWILLQDAFLDRSLPVELRWIAIITLKQGVERYWRKTATNTINKAEKQQIRSRLIASSIDEPHAQLAIQNAVIVGKVARLEFPLEWPKVFSEITDIIRATGSASANGAQDEQTLLRLTRALSILLHVVKELSTGRLTRTKTILQSVTPEVLKVLGDIYMRHINIWQPLLGTQAVPSPAAQPMAISLLSLKIMRRLIVSGYEFPNRAAEVNQAWEIFQGNIWIFCAMEKEITAVEQVHTLLKKHVINIGKLFLDVSSSHPTAFALLPNTLDLLGKYWEVVVVHGEQLLDLSKRTVQGITARNGQLQENEVKATQLDFREKVALQGMRLFRACLKMVYHPTSTFKCEFDTLRFITKTSIDPLATADRHKEEKEEVKRATEMLKEQLFTPQMVSHCMEVLVTKYFILRPSDLECWETDPEGFNEQWENSVESWEFLVRPCAEKFFNDLMVNHKDVLAQPLMGVFNSISSIAQDDILIKDAVYTAVGLAAHVLDQNLNFDKFIVETLVNEVQVAQPGFNIIRRRIAIMIGQWVSVKIAADTRPVTYQIMQHLLKKQDPFNDLVVRLAAAQSLKKCIDEWDFRVDAFLPYVDDLFHKLMVLIDEAEQTETRMGLLSVIGIIVDRLESRVTQYADRIVQILPPLWEQTGDEHLFKQAILAMLTKLVTAMKDKSVEYHTMVILPLIRYSVEPGSGMQVYLLEDALELWEATIKATPAPASLEVLNLFPYLIACLEHGSIVLRQSLDIIESYILLAPREILESYRGELFQAFARLLGSLKADKTGIITHCIEMLIRATKDIGGESALSIIGPELISSNFLAKVFVTLRESYDANQTSGPNRRYPPSAVMVTDYFSLLARIVITSTSWFMELAIQVADQQGQSVDEFMEWLLDEWFSHFANMGHPKQRKLNCFALTMLLETNRLWILKRLQDLMTVWTDVVTEIREEGAANDALVYWKLDEEPPESSSPERQRMNQLVRTDPVHCVDVVGFIKHHLEEVQKENGGQDAFRDEWVANIDPEVLKDFAKLEVV